MRHPSLNLKLPCLDLDDADATELKTGGTDTTKMNSVIISSPTCVRSLSKVNSIGSVDACSSANVDCTEEATGGQNQNIYSQSEITPLPAADITLNHVSTISASISTSSTISSEETNERNDAIGILPRGQAFMESVFEIAPGDTDFGTDGVRCIPESSATNIIDIASNNTTADVEVGYIPYPNIHHSSLADKQSSISQTLSAAAPAPITFVGIILERPETVNSWGLIFVKDKGGHALIVRVIPPTTDGPTVKWCQTTTTVPNPSTVYRSKTTPAMTLEQYEFYTVRNFPSPPEGGETRHDNPLFVPYLMPGDAILSVNGIPASTLDIGQLASYIRGHCQRKLLLVVMRHEIVLKAAQTQILQAATNPSSANIRAAWRGILASGDDVGQQQNNQIKRKPSQLSSTDAKRPKIEYHNVAFQNEDGTPILYCDNYDLDPDDGNRIHGFISDTIQKSFGQWHSSRKLMWRRSRIRKLECSGIYPRAKGDQEKTNEDEVENEEATVVHDFWRSNGHDSFETWLTSSKANWARSYSWHHERRQALQSKCTKEVHFPKDTSTSNDGNDDRIDQLVNWLSVRKQQWKLDRRKRNRHQSEMPIVPLNKDSSRICFAHENMYFDEILKNEEQPMPIKTSQLIDIAWVFDSQRGAPDDVIVNLMTFLCPSDHGNLLCLSYTTNSLFIQRNDMWKALFPSHWVVPRRPRKSWCAMYITKIRAEEDASRKRSDDLLIKASSIIQKGDQLSSLEKLIEKATKDFEFSVNYTSGVVLERNSLLNMAVIDRRHKITKWLVEEKGADIESCDRGRFTPLMNAAWNGDRYVTRYLLARGCDRTKVGFNHSSQGLASPKFEGLTAEGWARKRGHDEVAELIRLGL